MLFFLLAMIVSGGLVYPVKVDFSLHAAKTRSDLFIRLYVFYGMIMIPLHFRLVSARGEKLRIVRIFGSGRVKTVFPADTKKNMPSIMVKKDDITPGKFRFCVRCGTGRPEETVLLCAATESLFCTAVNVLFPDMKKEIYSCSHPDFVRHIFILNLEGIIHLNHVKIILRTITQRTGKA